MVAVRQPEKLILTFSFLHKIHRHILYTAHTQTYIAYFVVIKLYQNDYIKNKKGGAGTS